MTLFPYTTLFRSSITGDNGSSIDFWLRSPHATNYYEAWSVYYNGDIDIYGLYVALSHGVRPAVHINIFAAAQDSNLFSTVQSIQNTVTQLQTQMSNALTANDLTDIINRLNTLTGTVSSIQTRLDALDYVDDDELQTALDGLADDLTDAYTAVTAALETRIAALETAMADTLTADDLTDITNQLNTLSSTVSSIQDRLDALDYVDDGELATAISTAKQELTAAYTTALGLLETRISALETAMTAAGADITDITSELNTLSSTVSDIQTALANLDYVDDTELQTALDELENDITKAYKAALDELEDRIADLENAMTNAEADITKITNDLNTLTTTVGEIQTALANLDYVDDGELSDAMDELEESLTEAYTAVTDALDERIADLETAMADTLTADDLTATAQQIADIQTALNGIPSTYVTQATVDTLEQALTGIIEDIEGRLESKISELSKRLDTFTAATADDLEDILIEMEDINTILSSLGTTYATKTHVNQIVADYINLIHSLTNKMNNENATMKENMNALEAKINELQDAIAQILNGDNEIPATTDDPPGSNDDKANSGNKSLSVLGVIMIVLGALVVVTLLVFGYIQQKYRKNFGQV
jgi:chromosome segregation ATPase